MTDEATVAPGMDDAALLNRVRAGDTLAFGTLYQRHEHAARRLARILVGSPAEVDDVVAEAFARVLDVTRRSGGPTDAFRPYLLTALRRVCYDRLRGQQAQVPTQTERIPDPGEPFTDPAVASLEHSLMARAFRSLPERWSAVLWHTEIEESSPAELATLFGLSRNGVAALKHRAREGLRQAYLQEHISSIRRPGCQPVAGRLGAFVRDALPKRESAAVSEHLSLCGDCRDLCAELTDINVTLRGVVAPFFLGGAAAAYLAGASHLVAAGSVAGGVAAGAGAAGSAAGAGAAGSSAGAGAAGPVAGAGAAGSAAGGASAGAGAGTTAGKTVGWRLAARLRHVPRQHQLLAAGAGAAVVAGAAAALALTASPVPLPHHAQHLAGAAAPAPTARPQPARRPHRHPPARTPAVTPPATSPSTPASPGPSPPPRHRRPTPSPTGRATLVAAVGVHRSPPPQRFDAVVFGATDTGSAATGQLTALISLPAGSRLANGRYAYQGWTCQAVAVGVRCQHGPIAAGAQAPGVVYIAVMGRTACAQPVAVAVTSGTVSASAHSTGGVLCPPWGSRH